MIILPYKLLQLYLYIEEDDVFCSEHKMNGEDPVEDDIQDNIL